ncbi:MAG: hypothetical protein ACFFFG_07745 [Candidatus Thorarchaeota archaeon]
MATKYQITNNIADKISYYEREIKSVMRDLERLNLKESLSRARIELLLLQGYLKRAEFDLTRAKELFESAKLEAEKSRIKSLKKRSEKALKQLQAQMRYLERFHPDYRHALIHLQMQDAQSYLKTAQKMINHLPK